MTTNPVVMIPHISPRSTVPPFLNLGWINLTTLEGQLLLLRHPQT